MPNYECVIATKELIIKKWDEEIIKHNNSELWKSFKETSLRNLSTRIVYMGLLDGNIITECTAIISSDDLDMQNKDNLVGDSKAYLTAFRTSKEYENQGYFSKLYKYMESDLKKRGFKSLTLGVEPCEVRNIQIYFKWGFTKYIKTAYEYYPNNEKVIVNYYEKDLLNDINDNYYKAYEKRYQQVYKHHYLWSSTEPTREVMETIINEKIPTNAKILEVGCGEGRDAICLLNKNYNVLAIDYSITAIEKCRELANYQYNNNFKQFDIIKDTLKDKFDFIYSIAVVHMFVNKEHRDKFYSFIYNHLKPHGIALIVSMGDGIKEYKSDINKSFEDTERAIINNNKKINIATTSCNIVSWRTFEQELYNNGLTIKRKWLSKQIPEFNSAMCVIITKK